MAASAALVMAGAADSEAAMTKDANRDMGVWNLDTSDMTLAELEEYKK